MSTFKLILSLALAIVPAVTRAAPSGAKTNKSEFLSHYVSSCDRHSQTFSAICVGSSVADVEKTENVTMPLGDKSDRMVHVVFHPRDKPEGPHVYRFDEKARRAFYFYHNGEKVTRILCVRLDFAEIPVRLAACRDPSVWQDCFDEGVRGDRVPPPELSATS